MTRTAAIIVLLVCITAIAFGNTLTYGFVWDDHFLIVGNHLIRDWSSLPKIFTSHFWSGYADWKNYYRPLINVTYLLDYQVWQLNPLGYHLTNVSAHAAVILGLFWLISLLSRDWLTSLAAALLFALHPVHSQSVSFIAGRTDIVSALFVVASVALYHGWRQSRCWPAYAGSLGAFVLALLSKENAVVLPLILLVYEWAFPRRETGRRSLGEAARGVGPIFGVLALFLIVRFLVLGDMLLQYPSAGWRELPQRMLTAIKVASWYGWVTIVPYPVSPSQSADMVRSIWDGRFAVAAVGLAVLLGLTAVAVWHSRTVAFWAAWFWLTLAPSAALTLIPGTTTIASDRFLYLPSVGVCVILALGLRGLTGHVIDLDSPRLRRTPALALAALLIVFTCLTLWRNEEWKDDVRLYYRMVDTDPQSLVAAVNLGFAHLSRFESLEATPLFERALAIAPTNSRVLVGYGLLRAQTGHLDEGLRYALRGLGHEPQDASLHILVGRIYVIRGEHDKASAHFREAARLQPHQAAAHYLLAYALQQANHLPQAATAFEEGRRMGRQMNWHHRVVTKMGAEIYTSLDPSRAIEYWEQYAAELRRAPQGEPEQAEIAVAEAALRRLRADQQ